MTLSADSPALNCRRLQPLYASAKEICAFVQRSFAVSYTPLAIQWLSPLRHT
jgi:hypothetical protein